MGGSPRRSGRASLPRVKHPIQFEPEAAAELAEAALWYDEQHPGLGGTFLAAVESTLLTIDQWPDAAPLVAQLPADLAVRHAAVRRFPYRVAFLMHEDAIRVLAVAHTRRRPRYWASRVRSEPDT